MMKKEFAKRPIVLIMTLVMLMSTVSPIHFWAINYDPINMDLNDPNNPDPDNCWLPHGQLEYILATMRPIIDGMEKYVYTDKSYKDDFLVTDPTYFVGEGNEVTLYVKFVQTLWNGDTQSKYYYVIVHGPPIIYYLYMESLVGQSTYPILGNEGTREDPYATTITVPNNVDVIKVEDIKRTSDTAGMSLMFLNGDYNMNDYITSGKVDLVEGENHVYIVILNTEGVLFKYYDITVIRESLEFVIIYNANTGTGTMADQTVTYDSNVTLTANAFSKTGYVFMGWNTQADGTGTGYANSATFKYEIDGDLTLYAQWTPDPYTVTYKANGGTDADVTVNVVYDQEYELAGNTFTPPTGYKFGGWNTVANGTGTAYAPGAKITISDDVTLYAQWTPDPYTITYKANGGTGSDVTVNVVYDQEYEVAGNTFTPPTGYKFGGWNTVANGTGTAYAPGAKITISDDVTLYAQWTPDPYTITYKANGGTGADVTVNVVYDQEYEVAGNSFTPPTGYKFGWWNTVANGTGTAYAPGTKIIISDDVTLYAQWTPDPYTVTYKANGGTDADVTVNVVYDQEYEVAGNSFTPPTGYKFGGWNTVANGTGTAYAPGAKITISDDVTLYAQWTPDPHTVTYKANGGTGADVIVNVVYDQVYEVTGTMFTPPTGHKFGGWNTAADGTGTAYAPSNEIKIDDDVTLYAQWTSENNLKIIYNSNTGTGTMADQTVTYDSQVTLAANVFSKTGYEYMGWNTEADGSGTKYANQATFTYQINGNLELYAQWEIVEYDITYNLNGGTNDPANPDTFSVLDLDITLEDANRSGYTFEGWYLEATFVTKVTEIDDIGDWELYAKWVPTTTDGYIIYDWTNQPAPKNLTLSIGNVAQFYAMLDGVLVITGIKWVVVDTRLVTVNSNGLVSVNKNKYTGQATLMLYDSTNKLLDSITLRVV